jgi:hypothetical protein
MKWFGLVWFVLFSPVLLANGEVLKLNTTGTQYCAGFRPQVFNPSNDIDLWLRIDSPVSATLYDDPSLSSVVAVLDVECTVIASNKVACSMFDGDAADHVTGVGTLTVDSSGLVKTLKGTIVRRGVLNACFSKAVVNGRRVN